MADATRRPSTPVEAATGDDVLQSIADEAGREADRALEEADAKAAELIGEAKRSVEARLAEAMARAEAVARAEAARTVNEARLRLVYRRAARDAEDVDRVFEAAGLRLGEISSGPQRDRWMRALQGLVREGMGLAGPEARVETRARDADALRSALQPSDVAAFVVLASEETPGVRVSSADGRIEIDAMLPVLLERARTVLAEEIARILDVEG